VRILGLNITKRREEKQSLTWRALMALWQMRDAVWTPKDYGRLTEAGYENCTVVYACVNLLARTVAGIPLILYRRTGKKVAEIEDHPILTIMGRPNPQEAGPRFREKVIAYLLLAGNSYIEGAGPVSGPPKELYTPRPDRMKVLPGDSINPIRGYEYVAGGSKVPLPLEAVLHLRLFHPRDDFYGLSPLEVAAKAVDISNMGMAWNMKLLENDCRPPGGLHTTGNLSDEQFDRLNTQIKEKIAGFENAGTPLLLEGGLEWQSYALSPKDMDWLNSEKMTSRWICSIFPGISPELIGDSENKTFSNYQDARKALYIEGALPLLNWFLMELNAWLVPQFGEGLFLGYDRDDIEELQEERERLYNRLEKAWWVSINEKRRACGYEDWPGADVLMVPGGVIPLESISSDKIIEE